MSDDKPSLSINDLRKIYATNAGDELAIDLCYSHHKAFIKPMKVKDKKDLLKAIESKNEKLVQSNLDEIVEKYVRVEGYKSLNHMTVQERYQVLVAMRRAAAGDDTKIVHQCPKCEHVAKELNFNMANIVTVDFKEPETGSVIETANGAIKITLGPIRRCDEKILEKIIFDKKITLSSERQFVMLAGCIHKVEINQDDMTAEVPMDAAEKVEFFENLSSRDLDKITDYVKQTDHGVKIPFKFKCAKCDYENEQEEANVAVFFIN